MSSDKVTRLTNQLNSTSKTDRLRAIISIGELGPDSRLAIPALIQALNDPDQEVRIQAANVLAKIGPEAKMAVPDLIELLKDADQEVRSSAVEALKQIGRDSRQAIPNLIEALRDPYSPIRDKAAFALRQIGSEAVPGLIGVLKDSDPNFRSRAVFTLGIIGRAAKQAVPGLIELLKDPDPDVRSNAAQSLGQIGPEAKPATHGLIEALWDQESTVRYKSAISIGQIKPEAEVAVPALVQALKDPDSYVRLHAADSMGKFGLEAKPATTALIDALKDDSSRVRRNSIDALSQIDPEAKLVIPPFINALKDESFAIRTRAAEALSTIAVNLFDSRSTELLPQLKDAYQALQASPEFPTQAAKVKRTIDYFESMWGVALRTRIADFITTYYISIPLVGYLALQIIWVLLIYVKPLLLLRVVILLGKLDFQIKISKLEIPLHPRVLLVFPRLNYPTPVLDAWVEKYRSKARARFLSKQTVKERIAYVPAPASIVTPSSEDRIYERLSVKEFQKIFIESKVTVLITGEGGSGKTSLACKLARWAMEEEVEKRLCTSHPMLPVLIERNLEPQADGKLSLEETVRGRLQDLIGENEEIHKELFLQLLHKRRVLVIVDSLSELDDATRSSIRPARAGFPIACLVVTSRLDEEMDEVTKSTVKPLRLKGNGLSNFLTSYLDERGKGDLFKDNEFFDGCKRLSEMMGERDLTVLIAKMYAEQMIASKEEGSKQELPENLPDLMLSYIRNLNAKIHAGRVKTSTVISTAKIIASKCLEHTYHPSSAKTNEVLYLLSTDKDASSVLTYLEKQLQIIKTTGAAEDEIRFSLDPLAEYLAGLYLVENYGHQEKKWQWFVDYAREQTGAPEAIRGYLMAVLDCCVEKGKEYNVPKKVKTELALLAGLNPEAVSEAQLRQRITRLLADLKVPDPEDRRLAAQRLGTLGEKAAVAKTIIVELLDDPDPLVRFRLAEALILIGGDSKPVLPVLFEAFEGEDEEVRAIVAELLGRVGPDAIPFLLKALDDDNETVRLNAADAIGQMGPLASLAITPLCAALSDENVFVRGSAANALVSIGQEAISSLTKLLDDEDTSVSMIAKETISRIQSQWQSAD